MTWVGAVILKFLDHASQAQTGYDLLHVISRYAVPLAVIVGLGLIAWDFGEPRIRAKFKHSSGISSELSPEDPMIVPEPGWSQFEWDATVYQDRALMLRNRGGGDAKDIRVSDMSNRFGRATFREVGFIAKNDAEAVKPYVEDYDCAPMLRLRDLAHLVDAEFNPFGNKEGSIKILIEYKDVKDNKFVTTGRLVREGIDAHHQFKDLKFRRVT